MPHKDHVGAGLDPDKVRNTDSRNHISQGEPTQFVAMLHNDHVGAGLDPNEVQKGGPYCTSLVRPWTHAIT